MKNILFPVLALSVWASLVVVMPTKNPDSNPSFEVSKLLPAPEGHVVIKGQFIVQLSDKAVPSTKSVEFAAKRSQTREERQRSSEENAKKSGQLISAFTQKYNIKSEKIKQTYFHAFSGFAAELTEEEVEALKKDPNVLSIEPDVEIQLAPGRELLETPMAQTTPCGITNAGGFADGSVKGTWIWIVDTGIDLDHPDLNVQTASPFAISKVGGTADDCNGHGTHCAGTAAAKNNGSGVVGVSAGAKVVPVKVFASCTTPSSPSSTIISGIDHVAAHDIAGDVVNLSLGGPFTGANCATSSVYRTSVTNLSNTGTWVAIAAGNSAMNAANYQPACVSAAKIVTVASMACNKTFASSYSNFETSAAGPIDYIATGSSVLSTYKNGTYATLTGTSMATPHVAGILHQRNALPLNGGSVAFSGVNYIIAKR